MKAQNLFQNIIKNWLVIIVLLVLAGFMTNLMTGDITRMQAATTNYEYYQNYIYLIDNIARTFFFCIFMLMVHLTYINKQYSKWCVRLFYLLGASALLYFCFAGIFIKHVFSLVEVEYIDKFHKLAHNLYTGPLYWMIIGYFFTPKILKDARKLKEEQELTI